jgi:hypothetical protein
MSRLLTNETNESILLMFNKTGDFMQKPEEIANYYMNKSDTEAKIVLTLGKPVRRSAKLTPKKRKLFLQEYHKTKNKSRAAIKAGVTPQAINKLLESDTDFKQAFDFVNDIALDDLEEVSFKLGSSLTREGFNDRKLLLMANRSKYNPKQEIDVNHTINVEQSLPKIREILSRYGGAIDCKYSEINDLEDK